MPSKAAAKHTLGQVAKVACPSCGSKYPGIPPEDGRCTTCGGALDGINAPRLLPEVVKKFQRPQRLNPAQHASVFNDGNLLITACPGSGKTFVLRERAIRKLKQHPDERGVAVTFTRDAARELEHRILTGYPDAGGRMNCGTFHSLCKQQLEAANISVHLVNEFKQNELMLRAMKEIGDEGVKFDDVAAYIGEVKSRLHANIDLIGERAPLGMVYMRYQELLRQLDAMDFSDMLVLATQLMESGRVEPLDCTFLMVDEAQDSDSVQLAWVKAHLDKGIEVTVVGDDDQSIYGFRWSLGYSCLDSFKKMAQATHVSLDTTYRCAHEIVVPAGKLIAHNTTRMEKHLRTENRDQGIVVVKHFADGESELAEMVAHVSRAGKPEDWGILVRTNKVADAVEAAFGSVLGPNTFPITRKSGKSFWDLPEPAVLLALCRSLVFDDMVGVDTVLAMAGLSESQLRKMHSRYPPRKKGSLTNYLKSTPHAPTRAAGIEGHFAKVANQWRSMLFRGNTEMPLEAMKSYILECYSGGSAKRMRAERLLSAAAKSISGASGSAAAISNRLRNLSKEQKKDGTEVTEKAARLLTMHGSKGLEFKNVWIVGANASKTETDPAGEEEERRLFYVAMTRAKTALYITYCDTPTRFLAEADLLG